MVYGPSFGFSTGWHRCTRRKVFIMKSEKRPVTRLFEDLTLSQTWWGGAWGAVRRPITPSSPRFRPPGTVSFALQGRAWVCVIHTRCIVFTRTRRSVREGETLTMICTYLPLLTAPQSPRKLTVVDGRLTHAPKWRVFDQQVGAM